MVVQVLDFNCKELVELQGGVVKLESEKDKGTTFYFTLEYKKGTEKDLPEASKKILLYPELENIRLLLVEDNEINRF